MSKTTIATPAPCTDSRCREAVHTARDFVHVVDEMACDQWQVSVCRFVSPEDEQEDYRLFVKIDDALSDDGAAVFARELVRLREVCRLANLFGAWVVAA